MHHQMIFNFIHPVFLIGKFFENISSNNNINDIEIINSPKCGTAQTHAVAIVAYGNSKSVDYWVVKVSCCYLKIY